MSNNRDEFEDEIEKAFSKENDQIDTYKIEDAPRNNYEIEFEDAYKIEETEKQNIKKQRNKGLLFDLVFYLILIFVVVYIIPNYVIQRTYVDGDSMLNTLHNGDQLYVEKLSYHFDALKRFDIIVFYPYGRDHEDYYVKRIIGLPGETLQIIGSDIYINGKVLEEHYGKDPIVDAGRAANPIKLGDDEYFVMGDNRTISKDSRMDVVGNVKRENIGGKAILRVLPFKRFGVID